MNSLIDSHGRRFHYLRLSITDVCNFRCVYCLPNGYRKALRPDPLSVFEIKNLVSAFSALGFSKVRLTGGEPTTRSDVIEAAAAISSISGISTIALSTNGYRLKSLAPMLRDAGVSALNVSVDSLDRERFSEVTGQDRLDDVLDGLNLALELGFSSLKINTVLLRSMPERELQQFLDFVRDRPVAVRFIELMETANNKSFFQAEHLSAGRLRFELLRSGWKLRLRAKVDGPALEFEHPDYVGRIGIIAPYSKDFCSSCNRLRVSSQGALKLCLFGNGEIPLRDLLQFPEQKQELVEKIRTAILGKPPAHYLHEGIYGNTANLAAIGG